MPTTTPVDLSDAALWQNGFPDDLFVELRRERPIFHHELTDGVAQTVKRDFWMTTKHRHAQRIHRDTDAFTAADGPLIQGIGPIGAFPNVITMDPPVLTKRRRVMSHAFTPKAIAKLEDGIRRRAAAMIDGLLEAGGGDWIEDVADVLPMSVIGDIVGIPDEDRPTIFDTLDRILKANEPDDPTNPGDHLELFGQIFTYATELTAEKRRNPTDDIWSTLTTAVVTDETGQELSIPANELEIFFFVLTLAGSDTTKNALAAGLQAFVANPGEIARYRDDESIRASAVEEVLRWSSPVAFWTRTTKVDVEMDGITIPAGDRVVSMLRSANRDEDVFEDAFGFDIGRTDNPHVTFGGGGPHHCLGAVLARAEIRAALDELLLRADDISLGPAKVTYPNLTNNMSIYDGMPISLTPR
ncbi:cytochrome [Mycolicibacterium moriokaense]|uniref:Cytochrome P450 n=1 Tax=Mycolicibacterium moriokaense TaxID=39691 RepID=A0AAD1HBJ1_9MYCO|nr:cytochrome P450 [Mycolicibacterium moriokaense]MCV7038571.1 cytochrome P450 [Mycolicibacterium moriokaense]ORB24938.1 cytochrome [Mycolicibacterium moriokaense]BBX02305.1 putative cytochrome P450 [Mycolicibacterium moriokaense]